MPDGRRTDYLREYKKREIARISLDVRKDFRDEIKRCADRNGETVMGYIKKAIQIRMDMESIGTPATVEQKKTEKQNEVAIQSQSPLELGVPSKPTDKGKKRIVKDPNGKGLIVTYAPEDPAYSWDKLVEQFSVKNEHGD